MDDCLELECNPEMVTVARRFVRERLTAWEATDHLIDALVITSELVTNAVLHARTAMVLKLEVRGGTVRVEVHDENPRVPVMAPCPPDATSGRGLALVVSLSTSWGIEQQEHGKVVWAEVGPSAGDIVDGCLDLSGVDTVEEAFRQIESSDPERPRQDSPD